MAFRWFRKNDKATRWIYILVTVFVMLTFSITGAMLSGIGGGSEADKVAGSFRLPDGTEKEISVLEYHNVSQTMHRLVGRGANEDQIWTHLMLDALGGEAGIVVSDQMIADYIRQGNTIQTQKDLDRLLSSRGVSSRAFMEFIRREVRGMLYTQLNAPPRRILSEETFTRFQTDHELFKLDYIPFSEEAEKTKLEGSEVSEETLQAFYDDEIDATVKKNDYSTPEKFSIRAAVIDVADRSVDELRELLPENLRTTTDADVTNYQNRLASRYDDDADENDADESDADENEADENETDDESAEEVLSDATKIRIEKDILADRVITEAYREFWQSKRSRDAEKAKLDAKGAKDPAENTETTEPEEVIDEALANKTFSDLIEPLVTKYGLRIVTFPDAVTLDESGELPEVGSDDLQFTLRFMKGEEVRPRANSESVASPYLMICDAKVEAEALPFDEVKDRLKESWVAQTASKRAQEAADGFMDALRVRAREKEKEKVAEIETRVREEAKQEIADQKIEDEAARTKLIDDKLAAAKPEIDALLRPFLGDFFDEVVKNRGLTVESTDYFRKSYSRTAAFRDEPASLSKFVKGRAEAFLLNTGEVFGPVRDTQSSTVVVGRVADRKPPEFEQMRLGDRRQAEYGVMTEKFGSMFSPAGNPFSYESLALTLDLKRTTKETDPKDPDS